VYGFSSPFRVPLSLTVYTQDIKITTRWENDTTYRVEFDDEWLKNDDWMLPVYEVDVIDPGTTIIELSRLRIQITDEIISRLKDHLAATYAKFLSDKRVNIKIGSDQLQPITFEAWAYPPKYQPRKYVGKIPAEDGGSIKVEVLAGLSKVSSPAGGEYGVYFYCNDRLVARALKTYEVGFTKGLAGQPHPSVSLTRVIISLNGPVQFMPWNSSKSEINTNHNTFIALRRWLVEVVKDYASLSRRLEGTWPQSVFKYTSGEIKEVKINDFPSAKKSYLPPLPKSKLRYADLCRIFNRQIASSKPWTTGLYESIIAADLISGQRLEQRNRITLIILDSSLEIAFKEYLVNEAKHHYSDIDLLRLFRNRKDVVDEVEKSVSLNDVRKKIDYYYGLRCKLIHERASAGITDTEINDYRHVVESVMKRLFGLRFSLEDLA